MAAAASTFPPVRLVPAPPPEERTWAGPEAALLDPAAAGRWRVLGGPGSGKTALVADVAVAHARAGASVAVLAHSKEAAAELRADVAVRLGDAAAGTGGMIRSIHSLAFAVVRAAAVARGDAEPSLVPGARQDAIIHELLTGDDPGRWPERLRPALGLRGLSRQVRDLLLRAQERGLGPDDLEGLGAAHGIAEWSAAGAFLRQYEEIMRLSGDDGRNAAELVSGAVAEIAADPSLLDAMAADVLLVDDAQHLDPKSAELVGVLAERARLAVAVGDPGQAVLHFRGADGMFLHRFGDEGRRLRLAGSHRLGDAIAAASDRFRPEPTGPAGHPGTVAVHVHDTAAGERADVADFLRRAHLRDGIPWRDMAVILRGGAADSPLHRALARAGVPVRVDPTDVVLAEQRMVAAVLLALEAIVGEPDEDAWRTLLAGPLGQADPITMNRLVRAARVAHPHRKGMETLIAHLSAPAGADPDEKLLAAVGQGRGRTALDRVRAVVDGGRAGLVDGIEATLWGIWDAARLSDILLRASLRGGAAGASADRDLDAVMALFDFAGDVAEDSPTMTPATFLDHVRAQELPTGARDRRGAPRDAVSIITAHASLGRQWRAVAVAGVQEDVWPSLTTTGSLLHQQELVDLVDRGIEPGTPVSHVRERLMEERRLFHVAVSRASEQLLVTAVDSPDDEGEPSRFIAELGAPASRSAAEGPGSPADAAGAGIPREEAAIPVVEEMPRVLSAAALVAELRAAVVDDSAGPGRRRRAAAQLARLAEAGVPAAHPSQWWGLPANSTDAPVVDGPVRVSPSKVGRALECPLRTMLEQPEKSAAMSAGSIFHAAAEAVENGMDIADAAEELRRGLSRVLDVPGWRLDAELAEWEEALGDWARWVDGRPPAVTEEDVRAEVADGIVVSGRIDRLEDGSHGLVAVDIKTSRYPVRIEDAETDPQLSTYQLALHASGRKPGGALLAYPRKLSQGAPTLRVQAELVGEALEAWRATVVGAAESLRGPGTVASPGPHCETCRVRLACPTVAAMPGEEPR
ncbi:ATP-dependent DNA helicase [Corynebacterium sp.]|uniref:ATP-dependent helicase n=1 Tax=Corynebacterium sp. TaxID=1720 RepID=UPI0026DACEAA|nr:ATP-dependent DNA helicase [Corynebacterium sp.]MDO4610231.1 ATP-dependent DNA helicase [Corynebacterium sp.]